MLVLQVRPGGCRRKPLFSFLEGLLAQGVSRLVSVLVRQWADTYDGGRQE